MDLELPGKLWEFKEDDKGNEVGQFKEHNQKNSVYIDKLHYETLKIFAKRQEHKWDNWVVYSGNEGDGKSTLAKEDCSVMAHLCKGKFDHTHIAWEPYKFGQLLDQSNPGDSVLFDEGITGLSSQRSMSEVNHILKVKSTMCRKKRLYVAICIPSLFDLQRGIAIRRTMGMCKVYTDQVKRGFFIYYNRSHKKLLYLLGKKTEDEDAASGGPSSRFLRWSFINESEYEKAKDNAQASLSQNEVSMNKFKIQRDALVRILIEDYGCSQSKIAHLMKSITSLHLSQQTISDIALTFRENPRKTEISLPPTPYGL